MPRKNNLNRLKALDEYQVALAIGGDRRAFELLYRRWHPRLLRFAYHLTQNEDDARDLMQEAAISIATKIHRLENPSSFAAWAYTIVRRRAQDHIRYAVRHRRIKNELAKEPASPLVNKTDQTLALRQALNSLSKDDRVLLTLFYLDNMTGTELSVAMGVPIGTIKSRLFSAREKLKSIYEDF